KPYSWEVENLPEWLSFDSASGILSGTPEESGVYDLMARLRDREGVTDAGLLPLSVDSNDEDGGGGCESGASGIFIPFVLSVLSFAVRRRRAGAGKVL
ncbi:MAG: Ig domain-containing protein, partial [Synergistaceae bacterium]|nr:Ig domain-containing protein [Synergistaceae bacterium]